ncbi:Aste57867_25148 [Aphanomyces stellatus]|uniref:Aste57867_25148 protein n=1 Tax=Aphanomyces stellatus TaxID=120398 RepID=A0A485LSF5_9STRA|nr:hypothetical protein As57867_025070 [Aphanomyces stellatus]VFU01777.1 Aste57867_25148 [Aphanomyces stellatus]
MQTGRRAARPWLVLVVSPCDILRGTTLKEALSSHAIDLVQLRHNPTTPFSNDNFVEAMAALSALGPTMGDRPPHYVVNAPSGLVHPDDSPATHLDGWHYPERHLDNLLQPTARQSGSIFGVSVHSVAAANKAVAAGASYVQVGTMFPTASHPEKSVIEGPGLVREVRRMHPSVRLIGIGGITEGNCVEVLQAGADGVAVIRAILDSTEPARAAQQLRTALDAFHNSEHER